MGKNIKPNHVRLKNNILKYTTLNKIKKKFIIILNMRPSIIFKKLYFS
jgi:hypothetical protein